MKHYSVLQFNLLSLANELDNFPAGDDHPYQCLDKFPDRIMRKDVCDELLPVGSKTRLEPPPLPICSNCAREQVRSACCLPTSIILYLLYLPLSLSMLLFILFYHIVSYNYDIFVTVYKNASRDICRLELHHVDASIHLSPREIDELYHCTQVLCSRHSQLHMVR